MQTGSFIIWLSLIRANMKFDFILQQTTFAPNRASPCEDYHFRRKINDTFYIQRYLYAVTVIGYFEIRLHKNSSFHSTSNTLSHDDQKPLKNYASSRPPKVNGYITNIFNNKPPKAQNNGFQMPHLWLYNGEAERLLPEQVT